jgi:hypothetical protein
VRLITLRMMRLVSTPPSEEDSMSLRVLACVLGDCIEHDNRR